MGTHERSAAVQPGRDANNAQSGRILSARIGYDCNVIPLVLETARFLENADVAAVVREETRWRDLDDMTTHDELLPYTRNLRRSAPAEVGRILGARSRYGNADRPGWA